MRSIDAVGRYGGEEFLLLLVETPPESAAEICERLCQAVRNYDWSQLHPELSKVTVSVGYCGERSIDSAEKLVEAADRRLYIAKRNGKNQVCGSG